MSAILDTLGSGNVQRIIEDPGGFVEANPVFSLVQQILGLIPLKAEARHC